MQVLVKVAACAVCRTDLHVVNGELPNPKLPLVPGHEIVGVVLEKGERARRFKGGDRVGIPWLAWTCGECSFCREGRENLCDCNFTSRPCAAWNSSPPGSRPAKRHRAELPPPWRPE